MARGLSISAMALANLSRPHDAIESYLKVLEFETGDASTFYNLGIAYEELEDHPTAISFLLRAVQDDPEYAEAWYSLGCCYDGTDRNGDARPRRPTQCRGRGPRDIW